MISQRGVVPEEDTTKGFTSESTSPRRTVIDVFRVYKRQLLKEDEYVTPWMLLETPDLLIKNRGLFLRPTRVTENIGLNTLDLIEDEMAGKALPNQEASIKQEAKVEVKQEEKADLKQNAKPDTSLSMSYFESFCRPKEASVGKLKAKVSFS